MRRILVVAVGLLCLGILGLGLGRLSSFAQTTPGSGAMLAHPVVGTGGSARSVLPPNDPISFVLDDGTIDDIIGWGNPQRNVTYSAVWLNRFTPGAVAYPLTLNSLSIFWPTQPNGSLLGRQVRLLAYVDPDSDNNPRNAILLAQQTGTIDIINAWQTYTWTVTINTPGDLYLGYEDQWAEPHVAPLMYSAAIDETASQHRSWAVARSDGSVPDMTNLGANNHVVIIDQDGFPGNWMIRAGASTYVPPTATPIPPSPTPCTAGQFSDVHPSDYFYAPVQYLVQHGVISGYSDCTFRPYNNTTRAQMVKIVVLGFAIPITTPGGGNYTFHDVPPTAPFFDVIETAAARGIVSGYACGGPNEPCDDQHRAYFRPNADVTRGQLSKITAVAAGWPLLNPPNPTFTDVAPGSPFYTFVETAACHGVISGYSDGTFRPGANATRGQIAKIEYLAITGAGACTTPTPVPATSTPVGPTDTATPTATSTAMPSPTGTVTPAATPSPTSTPEASPTALPRQVSN